MEINLIDFEVPVHIGDVGTKNKRKKFQLNLLKNQDNTKVVKLKIKNCICKNKDVKVFQMFRPLMRIEVIQL